MRTAVFGGSFNPPHDAHLQLAAAIRKNGYADRVIIIPAFRPPHKPETPLVDYRHRMTMTRLAFAAWPWAEVSDIESSRPELPSYTFDTMAALEKLCPDSEFSLLIGADSLRYLHTWYRAAEIVDRWPVLSYPRPDEIPDEEELKRNWPAATARKLAAGILTGLPQSKVSSTELRQRLARGEEVGGQIPEAVLEYIGKNKIYR